MRDVIPELRRIVGSDNVVVDAGIRASFERDLTGRFSGTASAVVSPATTAETAAVLAACDAAGASVVPQGGNTGMVGGAVPTAGEVVLRTARLRNVEPFDPYTRSSAVGAGVTLARVQVEARSAGMAFGVDFGARDSATIGGMTATDAGGIHVLRYGTTADQVLGLVAVLADGTVIDRLHSAEKDTAGFAIDRLLIGSEGTLAVITEVRVRFHPDLRHRVTALVGLGELDAAVELALRLRQEAPSLYALEFIDAVGYELVRDQGGLADPLGYDAHVYVLVECAGVDDPTAELAAALGTYAEIAAVADDSGRREGLWAFRERQTEAISTRGIPHKFDVAVPLARISTFVNELRERVDDVNPGATTIAFGHLAEGNLHVNVLGFDPDDDKIDGLVLGLVAELGGTISAEHGVGLAKARWLGLTRSPEEIEAMQRLKRALDPNGTLNPGKVLERHARTSAKQCAAGSGATPK